MADWASSRAKTARYDTEAERRPVKPHLAPQKASEHSTGFTSQVAGMMADSIVDKAIKDRTAQLENEGWNGGYNNGYKVEANGEMKSKDDEDKDGAGADADDDLEALRARRRKQMKEMQEKKQKNAALGHGGYDEIAEEEFLKVVTSSNLCVVHFYHRHFEKCKIMDMHLSKCAKKFFGTRFVKLNAEKAPFFVEKLAVRTLPCVIVFIDGVAKGRQVGFEGLGGEEFATAQLAWKLKEWEGIEEEVDPDEEF
ncbi:unnamed protein product [Cladocopium goreaui]|uniref:Thioredoxin domain-containing protein n=1 Tax=Cladocopium goreaui TaxID=2562237 RepID=A0A9P1FQF6_9DINO|nr:unnamed protein product [Cladocopium goreaui]|mmetsp:Transcript_21778/g.47750  ORF Transcript_21778/g.47750 Transcript_21778/m.47750 type:complete len:253 (+) Transcript_21778:68-826(+)